MSTTITVKIGTFERTYTLVRTTAPKEYDGFGTLEVYESGNKEERYVLIDVTSYRFGVSVIMPIKHYLHLFGPIWITLRLELNRYIASCTHLLLLFL